MTPLGRNTENPAYDEQDDIFSNLNDFSVSQSEYKTELSGSINDETINIISFNIRSMKGNYTKFNCTYNNAFDILALSETRLTSKIYLK